MEFNSPQASTPSTVTTASQPSGAFVRMLYVEREVKGYAVTASELRQMGGLNRIATLFFALGGGAVGFALGIWWDVATRPAEPIVQTVGNALLKVCVVGAIICFSVAGYLAYARSRETKEILGQSKSTGG